VYLFFDNTDVKLRAPVDARRMAERLGVATPGTSSDVVRELRGKAPVRRARAAPGRNASQRGSPARDLTVAPKRSARRPSARSTARNEPRTK
jgi:hypothetical protein